ncbi:hypothetical protein [Fluviicola chungangensis]|uniref:Uncharacterized protein n=1 Tax=Fluviicola chungangensis TaxID=2597671 RepID=A0A556N6A4_9FLAO|nr:hypothetical protein [Fluviicola chungangensis]TSJ47714.1 hypothetical protein FO442_00885 [Fluviicola chungangensis]
MEKPVFLIDLSMKMAVLRVNDLALKRIVSMNLIGKNVKKMRLDTKAAMVLKEKGQQLSYLT